MASFRPPQPYPPELHDKITRLLAPPSLPSMQQPFNRASRLSSAGSRRSEQHSGFDDGFNYQQLERDIRSIGAYSTASVLPPYKSDAGQKIWKAWERYKLRTTFKILKSELLKCQKALTFHLLKKLSPREVEILKDPILQARIRFRFGGSQFPPLIYYKVYTLGTNVHYFSGNRVIKAGSQASVDAHMQMGNQRYFATVLHDEMRVQQSFLVPELTDVTNKMELIQYINSLDQRPPHLGGRNNGWRILDGTEFPFVSNVQYELKRKRNLRRKRKANVQNDLNSKLNTNKEDSASKPNESMNLKQSTARKLKYRNSKRKNRLQCLKAKKINQLRQLYGFEDRKDMRQTNDYLHGTRSEEWGEESSEENNDSGSIDNDGAEDEEPDDFDRLFEWTNDLSFEMFDWKFNDL